MTTADKEGIVRLYFESFRTANRQSIEALLADDFTFTSPQDDHVDRNAFFERCWVTAGNFDAHDIHLLMVDGDDAVVQYDAKDKQGVVHRNTERLTFAGDRIRSVEVFFGSPPDTVAAYARQEILTLLEQRQEALEMKDARLLRVHYSDSPLEFALAPPLASRGELDGVEAWFRTWEGFLQWETRNPEITVSGDVAFVTALEHLVGKKTTGAENDLWFRLTLGLRRIDGKWLIVHEHQSVPFYMDGSLRAAVDLEPDAVTRIDRSGTEQYLS